MSSSVSQNRLFKFIFYYSWHFSFICVKLLYLFIFTSNILSIFGNIIALVTGNKEYF